MEIIYHSHCYMKTTTVINEAQLPIWEKKKKRKKN